MLVEIVGKYEAVVKSLNIARRALEEQAIDIEEKDKTISNLQRALAEERAGKARVKVGMHLVNVYQFPHLTPGK